MQNNVIGKMEIPHDREINFDDPEFEELWNKQWNKIVEALQQITEDEVSVLVDDRPTSLYYSGEARFESFEYIEYDGPDIFYVEGDHPELADAWWHCDSVPTTIEAETRKDYFEDVLYWRPVIIEGKCAFKLQ